MGRRTVEQITTAARSALVDGERVIEYGHCWAAQRRDRLPLVFAGRREFLMVLTDRRVLLFARRARHGVQPSDLVIGKRYETFTLERVRRARPLLQLRVQATNGSRMVFEFRPGRRHVGEALVHRLDPRAPVPVRALTAAPEDLTAEDERFWGPAEPSS